LSHLAGTTEVSNILAKYPQWDRSPPHLKLPAMSRESKEIPDSAEHIKLGSWRGNVKLKDVSLLTSWNRGRRLIEQECDSLKHILLERDILEGIDILAPFGTLLIDVPLSDNDIDESLGVPTVRSTNRILPDSDAHKTEMHIDIENELAAGLASSNTKIEAGQNVFDSKVLIQGVAKNKARALKEFSKFRKHAGSTDRLKPYNLSQDLLIPKNYSTQTQTTCSNQRLMTHRKSLYWTLSQVSSALKMISGFASGKSVACRLTDSHLTMSASKCLQKRPLGCHTRCWVCNQQH